MKAQVETLDGIPVDRRPEVNILDPQERAQFIAKLKTGKFHPDSVKLVTPDLTNPTVEQQLARNQELSTALSEIKAAFAGIKFDRQSDKKARKASRPAWRR